MDLKSGFFTAPFDGVYFFTFSSHAGNLDVVNWVAFAVVKNGWIINYVSETDEVTVTGVTSFLKKSGSHLTTSWMMQLKKGDTVSIKDYWSKLLSYDYRPTYFSGQLIMKE